MLDYHWLAAKSDNNTGAAWLPLWMHSKDTAGIMRLLVEQWIPESVRRFLHTQLPNAAAVAAFLGYVHDIGKATAIFQSTITAFLPDINERLQQMPSILPSKEYLDRGATPHARSGEAILLSLGCPCTLASVVGAHHGTTQTDGCPDYLDEAIEIYSENFGTKQNAVFWKKTWRVLYENALHCAGFSCAKELPGKLSVPVELLLTGLLITADWIASNTQYFPLIPTEDNGLTSADPERVNRAWSKLSLTFPWEAQFPVMERNEFMRRFPFPPNEVQRNVLSVVNQAVEPGLYILEAQMGCGKTEAALAAAEVLAAKFQAGGLFFGLPTQATSNSMFERMLHWAQTQSEETEHSIQLAHGLAQYQPLYQKLAEGRAVTQEDAPPETGVLVHQWFQGSKRALLAEFVVGTVDHLLLAALCQRHLMLRHLGLAGKVVIVDEVHAYDAYMSRFLERVLMWLGAYHVPVLLLSATLPSRKRKDLTAAYTYTYTQNSAAKNFSTEFVGYPMITWTEGDRVYQKAIPWNEPSKKVKIGKIKEKDLVGILTEKLALGGCAGVIVNTVKTAQRMALALRKSLSDYEIILFHAQFLQSDRMETEKTLIQRLGKQSAPQDRQHLIVIGTQVLEQSLDIDFDLLITELCPMDLLLQRIGRAHRHKRSRPTPLQDATCLILQPNEKTFDTGTKMIYGQWLLEKTEQELPTEFTLPEDIPRYVEKVYGEAPASLYSDADSFASYQQKEQQKKDKASGYLIKKPAPLSRYLNRNSLDNWMDFPAAKSDTQARASVRDSDPSIDVLVLQRKANGEICFLPWIYDGVKVSADEPPSYEIALKISAQRLRLPRIFATSFLIDTSIMELEEKNKQYLPQWQQSPVLKGELVLLLDENLSVSLAGYSLQYDRQTGLHYEKEDNNERERV